MADAVARGVWDEGMSEKGDLSTRARPCLIRSSRARSGSEQKLPAAVGTEVGQGDRGTPSKFPQVS
jgi:hypothetical protein